MKATRTEDGDPLDVIEEQVAKAKERKRREQIVERAETLEALVAHYGDTEVPTPLAAGITNLVEAVRG